MQRRAAARPAAAGADAAAPVAAEPSSLPPPPPPPWPGIRAAFALTYAAFAVCYLTRATASSAKKALSAQLSLSDGALGGLDALFLGAYTAGNFTLGVRACATRRAVCAPEECVSRGRSDATHAPRRPFGSAWRTPTPRGAC
jgi:hypothetical protein